MRRSPVVVRKGLTFTRRSRVGLIALAAAGCRVDDPTPRDDGDTSASSGTSSPLLNEPQASTDHGDSTSGGTSRGSAQTAAAGEADKTGDASTGRTADGADTGPAATESTSTAGDTDDSCLDALASAVASDRLIVEVDRRGDDWLVTLESGSFVVLSGDDVIDVLDDPAQWTTAFVCAGGEVRSFARLGDALEVPLDALEVDPYATAPLAARLRFSSPVPGHVSARVIGHHGAASDVTTPRSAAGRDHTLTVLGLYAGETNHVEILFSDSQGRPRRSTTLDVRVEPLGNDMPTFHVDVPYEDPQPHVGILFNYQPLDRPIFVDAFGDVRYILMDAPGTKVATQRLRNGNLAHGIREAGRIDEYSWLGEHLESWSISAPFAGLHHEVIELPSGNFLVATSERGAETIEDIIVEIERSSGNVVQVWDLRESLPTTRQVLSDDLRDWVHVNGLAYDPEGDAILVSSQRHGVLKLDRDNDLQWILSPREGWEDVFVPYLLTLGPDTEPPWGQHAPLLRENGNLLLFDNGAGRVPGLAENFSRIVEYTISPEPTGGGFARRVFEYGRDRPELYSPIISDVDHFEADDHRLMVTGALAAGFDFQGPSSSRLFWERDESEKARVLEVDVEGRVFFEIAVQSSIHPAGAVYRAEKMRLQRQDH